MIFSMSSFLLLPNLAHACGKIDAGDVPGIVFTSRKYTFHSLTR